MFPEYIKNNYVTAIGSGSNWKLNIKSPTNPVNTYFIETLNAIEYIYSNNVGKFQVLYSGGADSEYICNCFLYLGISFDPIIINLVDGSGNSYNIHDYKYAIEFCKCKNLNPIIYTLDFQKFVNDGDIVSIANEISCAAIEVPATVYIAGKLDGFTILGNNPPYLKLNKTANIWEYTATEEIFSTLKYYEKFKLNGCPFLLSYTPEMLLSFLLDPTIKNLCTNKLPGKIGSNSSKSHVYNNGSNFNIPVYDFTIKNRIKFSGYEKIYEDSWFNNHPNIKIFHDQYKKTWNGSYSEPYDILVQRLLNI